MQETRTRSRAARCARHDPSRLPRRPPRARGPCRGAPRAHRPSGCAGPCRRRWRFDADDGVGRLLDVGVRNLLPGGTSRAVEDEALHVEPSFLSPGRSPGDCPEAGTARATGTAPVSPSGSSLFRPSGDPLGPVGPHQAPDGTVPGGALAAQGRGVGGWLPVGSGVSPTSEPPVRVCCDRADPDHERSCRSPLADMSSVVGPPSDMPPRSPAGCAEMTPVELLAPGRLRAHHTEHRNAYATTSGADPWAPDSTCTDCARTAPSSPSRSASAPSRPPTASSSPPPYTTSLRDAARHALRPSRASRRTTTSPAADRCSYVSSPTTGCAPTDEGKTTWFGLTL